MVATAHGLRVKNKITLFLALSAAGLLGLVLLLPNQAPAPDPTESLLPLDPARAQRIELSRGDGQTMLAERTAAGWILRAPFPDTPANPEPINALLEVLQTPRIESFELPAGRLAEFGLQPPKAVLRVNDAELRFGDAHPLEPMRYVQHQTALHLIHDRFLPRLTRPPEDFVSPRIIAEGRKITAIHTATWSIEQGAGEWRLQGLGDQRQSALKDKIQGWSAAQAASVEPAPNADAPSEVQVRFTEGPDCQFAVLQHTAGLVLVNRDTGIGYRLHPQTTLMQAP